jgi:hypothetical protein
MAKKTGSQYDDHKNEVMTLLEEIQNIGGTPREYKTALLDLKESIDDWMEASINAAEDDVRRG